MMMVSVKEHSGRSVVNLPGREIKKSAQCHHSTFPPSVTPAGYEVCYTEDDFSTRRAVSMMESGSTSRLLHRSGL